MSPVSPVSSTAISTVKNYLAIYKVISQTNTHQNLFQLWSKYLQTQTTSDSNTNRDYLHLNQLTSDLLIMLNCPF